MSGLIPHGATTFLPGINLPCFPPVPTCLRRSCSSSLASWNSRLSRIASQPLDSKLRCLTLNLSHSGRRLRAPSIPRPLLHWPIPLTEPSRNPTMRRSCPRRLHILLLLASTKRLTFRQATRSRHSFNRSSAVSSNSKEITLRYSRVLAAACLTRTHEIGTRAQLETFRNGDSIRDRTRRRHYLLQLHRLSSQRRTGGSSRSRRRQDTMTSTLCKDL